MTKWTTTRTVYLTEMAQALEKTKHTDEPVAQKLADISNNCQLEKHSDEKRKA